LRREGRKLREEGQRKTSEGREKDLHNQVSAKVETLPARMHQPRGEELSCVSRGRSGQQSAKGRGRAGQEQEGSC